MHVAASRTSRSHPPGRWTTTRFIERRVPVEPASAEELSRARSQIARDRRVLEPTPAEIAKRSRIVPVTPIRRDPYWRIASFSITVDTGNNPSPDRPERLEQRRVVELGHRARAISWASNHCSSARRKLVLAGHQHRRAVERAREPFPQLLRESGAAWNATPHSPSKWLNARTLTPGGNGPSEMTRSSSWSASWPSSRSGSPRDTPARLAPGQVERRLDEPVRNELRDRVGDTHREPKRPSRGPILHGVHQLAPDREDLVGVAVHDLAHLGEHQPASPRRSSLVPSDRSSMRSWR